MRVELANNYRRLSALWETFGTVTLPTIKGSSRSIPGMKASQNRGRTARVNYGREESAYSSRNTLIGSTLDARRAGIQHAARAISVRSAATSANVTGLVA